MSKSQRLQIVGVGVLLLLCGWRVWAQEEQGRANEQSQRIELRVPGYAKGGTLMRVGEDYFYRVETLSGETKTLTPSAFAKLTYRASGERLWWKRMLNVTTVWGVLWVGVGLLGQVLFTGRMVVQWIQSEKQKASVIPVSFWWMSLSGASMLVIYFIWRKDIVGVLGQTTGWFIYIRNLILIYRPKGEEANDEA